MDRKGRTVFCGSLGFLLIAGCVSVIAFSPVRAVERVTTAQAVQLADGIWTQGRLSGTVSHARATVPIQNLVLTPDGSFSGTAPASFARSRHAHASKITGQFSGDMVNLTFDSEHCPPRQGTATRRALGD